MLGDGSEKACGKGVNRCGFGEMRFSSQGRIREGSLRWEAT